MLTPLVLNYADGCAIDVTLVIPDYPRHAAIFANINSFTMSSFNEKLPHMNMHIQLWFYTF